ncbi:MAG: hypothetical protein ACRD44_18515 [Bryobacteraceae bacterium]
MSWQEAITRLEETSALLASLEPENPALPEVLETRAKAVESVRRPPPEVSPDDIERLMAAFQQGEEALRKLRLARAASRTALVKLSGDAYRLRRLRGDEPPPGRFELRG